RYSHTLASSLSTNSASSFCSLRTGQQYTRNASTRVPVSNPSKPKLCSITTEDGTNLGSSVELESRFRHCGVEFTEVLVGDWGDWRWWTWRSASRRCEKRCRSTSRSKFDRKN